MKQVSDAYDSAPIVSSSLWDALGISAGDGENSAIFGSPANRGCLSLDRSWLSDHDVLKEDDDPNFLSEIVEISSTASLKNLRPQRLLEWPEFMAMRCRLAKKRLKQKIRKEAKLGIYGFVPLLPLFSFDVNEHSLFRRPKLSEIKSLPFRTFVEYVHGLGFSCFIDRPGLEFWCNRDANKAYDSRVAPSDFGLYAYDYFNEMGVPESQRHALPDIHWVLYVLLPGQEAPHFSLERYFRYKWDRFCTFNMLATMLLLASFTGSFFIIAMLTMYPKDSEQYHGNPLNKVLQSIESQLYRDP